MHTCRSCVVCNATVVSESALLGQGLTAAAVQGISNELESLEVQVLKAVLHPIVA